MGSLLPLSPRELCSEAPFSEVTWGPPSPWKGGVQDKLGADVPPTAWAYL